jgi:hypothetical protein
MTEINKLLLRVRLPIESSRSTRSFNERRDFKANEWRDIAFYIILPILQEFLEPKYYINLVKYIVFLRILCQDSITESDLQDAELIINDFMVEYEILYGSDNMTYNLHCHLHLVKQVRRFGPLTKCSCFCFENMFRITRSMFKGTRNYEGQIGRNLLKYQSIKLKINDLKKETKNPHINEYICKYIDSATLNRNNSLLNPKKKTLSSLKLSEKLLFKEFDSETFIQQSNTAQIRSKGYYKKILIK